MGVVFGCILTDNGVLSVMGTVVSRAAVAFSDDPARLTGCSILFALTGFGIVNVASVALALFDGIVFCWLASPGFGPKSFVNDGFGFGTDGLGAGPFAPVSFATFAYVFCTSNFLFCTQEMPLCTNSEQYLQVCCCPK